MKLFQTRVGRRMYQWLGLALLANTVVSAAQAVPLFARQTGQNCVACHVSFPELTPYGRWFKLSGYTIGARQDIPLAMMAQVGVQSVANNDDGTGTGTKVTDSNNRAVLNGASLFAGGKVTDNFGALVQWTYSQTYRVGSTSVGGSGIDNSDLRLVGRMSSADANDVQLLYGVTVHNNPTVQDVWNSTPAWGYPFTVSPTALHPAAATQIEGALAAQVAGVGAYGFYNRSWYGELSLYRTADSVFNILRAGYNPATAARLQGSNPYVRLAYNHEWANNSLMLGAMGMRTVRDASDPSAPGAAYNDYGVDAQYQFITQMHTFTAQASYIHEKQDYTNAANPPGNAYDSLNSAKLKGTYYYDRQYGLTLEWFRISGTADPGLYAANATTGSGSGSPNSQGYVVELNYLPLQNLRLVLQYTGYTQFNGGNIGYDGATSRKASDNNTLFLNAWVAF